MTLTEIRDRVSSVCASAPFGFTRAATPFSFELQPSGGINEVFRIESEAGSVIGGFNYIDDRTDLLQIWVARKYDADPERMYQRLVTDATSLRAAVIRDGCQVSGDYSIPDGGLGVSIQREAGKEFAVVRVTVPVNYETTV